MSDALAALCSELRHSDPDLALIENFLPPQRRNSVLLWEALLRELRVSWLLPADGGVARAKLQWWGEELLRQGQGRATHPLTRALSDEHCRLPYAWCTALIDGALHQLNSPAALELPQRVDHLLAFAAPASALGWHVADCLPGDTDAAARAMAWSWLARWLWRLPQEQPMRDWLVPISLLARTQISREQLAIRLAEVKAGALIMAMAEQIAQGLAEANVPAADLVGSARLALQRLAMDGLARNPARIVQPAQRGAPLRRLWRVWRAARSARAQQRAGTGS